MLISQFDATILQSSNGSLIFTQARRKDTGWYLCEADNDVGLLLSQVVKMNDYGEITDLYVTYNIIELYPADFNFETYFSGCQSN